MNGTLIIFAREPVPGEVKTRLIPALGAPGAARLYRILLERALSAAAAVPLVRLELWCAGTGASQGICADLARRFGMRLRLQPQGDLGARMALAFTKALSPGPDSASVPGPAVLIGSDCPGYHGAYIARAFEALSAGDGGCDVVLGPATDGGYVLIGLRRPAPSLFTDMPWGTDRVLKRTRATLSELRLRWLELPPLADIDRPEDLAAYPDLAEGLRHPTILE
ncbi:MAG: TIGR04282 family arsenosugar biosynthesis glycosyltransferase [Chromatiaceae bacterium]